MVGLGVYVGMAKISLVIDQSHSLKEKRMVLRRIKDRVQQRLHVQLSEVGELDSWQRAELGTAVVSGDRGKALELIDDVVRVAVAAGGAQIFAIAKTVTTFEAESLPFKPIDDRTGGYRGERKYGNAANLPPEPATRARKNDLDEMTVKRTEVPLATRARKPELDEMGVSSNLTSVATDEGERPQRPDPMTTNHRPRSVGGRPGSSAGRKGPKRH